MVSAGFLPILYFILDDRAYKKARATHYGNYLKMLLPIELECNTALISRFEPQTEVAIIYDGKGFFAIVKRDPRTESFFG